VCVSVCVCVSVYAYDCLMYFDWPNCHCLNYPDKGTGSINLRKKLESQNEITIVGQYGHTVCTTQRSAAVSLGQQQMVVPGRRCIPEC